MGDQRVGEVSPEEATARARAATGLNTAVEGRASRVRRLDRQDDAYYLVVFGAEDAAVAVVAVGAAAGEIRNSAVLPGRGPHITVDAERAIELAGLGRRAGAALVWRPCRASRSPLYPLWEISSPPQTVYVDQGGAAWQQLEPAGPGG